MRNTILRRKYYFFFLPYSRLSFFPPIRSKSIIFSPCRTQRLFQPACLPPAGFGACGVSVIIVTLITLITIVIIIARFFFFFCPQVQAQCSVLECPGAFGAFERPSFPVPLISFLLFFSGFFRIVVIIIILVIISTRRRVHARAGFGFVAVVPDACGPPER